jgi:hypothetical protein
MRTIKKDILFLILITLLLPTLGYIGVTEASPTINWPSFVIIGRPFTFSGETPLPNTHVRAIVYGIGSYQGKDYAKEGHSNSKCVFTLTLDIPTLLFDFYWKWDDATGYKVFLLTVDWGSGSASEWIHFKFLSDYTFEPCSVEGWPGSVFTMGKPFTLTGLTPLPNVPVRLEVYGGGPDDGKDYVEEVRSDKECKFKIIATIPKGYQIFWEDPIYEGGVRYAYVRAQVTWGYWPIEPYGASEWKFMSFSEEIWDDSNGGGGSDGGGGGGGGGYAISTPPKNNEKIVQIFKSIYDNKNIREKEDLTNMKMTQFKISETKWANIHIAMRK